MRGGRTLAAREEEEESAFVSMTDMTVSFLFIVMILLAFFASQLHDPHQVPKVDFDRVVGERDKLLESEESKAREIEGLRRQLAAKTDENRTLTAKLAALQTELADARKEIEALKAELEKLKKRPLEDYLGKVAAQRKKLLEALQERLKMDFPDLQVVVSEEYDALRFKGDGLFETDSEKLKADKVAIVRKIAGRLSELLPCFTIGKSSHWREDCNPDGAVIEAVQIEGHTDSSGADDHNLTLSTNRADETFFVMTRQQPQLVDYLNSRDQPVISVAGYGKMRPVADNGSAEGKATNRRIDLRLIMYTPNSLDDIKQIQARLRAGLSGGPKP